MTALGHDQLGPYRLVRWIAGGGMGDVWEAAHCGRRGAPVALKVIRAEAGSCAAREALREARIGLRLDHPNIAQTFDIGFVRGRAYVVLELLRGATLAELCPLPGEAVPTPWAAGVALQALAGLHHAHTAVGSDGRWLRLVHRDIKGSNLFLTKDGEIKLLDFGIASIVAAPRQEGGSAQTGTLAYMAPERIAGQPGDSRSDLYALALVLAELLSGVPAFDELDDASARAAILRSEIAPLRALPEDVPSGLRRWLERALRRDPQDRFESAAEMARALRWCVAEPWGAPRLVEWYAARVPAGRRGRTPATRRLDPGHPGAPARAVAPSTPWVAEAFQPPEAGEVPFHLHLPSPGAFLTSARDPLARWSREPARASRRSSAPGRASDATARVVALSSRWPSWTTASLALLLLLAGWRAPADDPAPHDRAAEQAAQTPPSVAATRPRGWITVRSHPPRARIFIGGKELGEAPLVRYPLPAGRHVVEAVRPDGTRRFQRVQVVAGRGQLLSFR
jgi:serine/threonine-protein kinase